MKRLRNTKGTLEALLVIGLILIIPLFFVIRSQAGSQAVSNIPNTAMPLPPTAANAPADSNALKPQQPPACTFPLAQTTTAESTPEEYTFSEPQVVYTPNANETNVEIVGWLPDNQQVLVVQNYNSKGLSKNNLNTFV